MKMIIYKVYIGLFLTSTICFGQKPDNMSIDNLKKNEIVRKDGLVWYDNNNIIKANFKEKYKSEKYTSPADIAIEYLKVKHKELGITKELKDIKLVTSKKFVNKENFYFNQSYNKIPIFGTEIVISVDNNGTITYVLNDCKSMEYIQSIYSNETITEQEALRIALKDMKSDGKTLEYKISKVYAELENKELLLCWEVRFENWIFLISTIDGTVQKKGSSVLEAGVQTKVFAVNPLYTAGVSYGTAGYIDNWDFTTPQLNAQLIGVTLEDVSHCTALGKEGYANSYCYIVDFAAPNLEYNSFYQDYPLSTTASWYDNMDREDDMFEVAMVLFHTNKAGQWVESLGYSPSSVFIDPHAGLDGDTYDDTYANGAWTYISSSGAYSDEIRFGVGGVDAAEDQVAIWHEYAHHVNYSLHPTQSSFFNYVSTLPTASVLEGFADYFAGSYKKTINGWDPATLAEWALAKYYILHPERRRRTDTGNVYPDDYGNDDHLNGQIFSSALMAVENNIGRYATNKILLESIGDWGNSPSLPSVGENFINASENLYGKEYLCECVSNFKSHGLTQRPYSLLHKYVLNETIQSSVTYNDMCDITFENVVIDNSPYISVIADPLSGETTITKSFEVKLGSTFEIK